MSELTAEKVSGRFGSIIHVLTGFPAIGTIAGLVLVISYHFGKPGDHATHRRSPDFLKAAVEALNPSTTGNIPTKDSIQPFDAKGVISGPYACFRPDATGEMQCYPKSARVRIAGPQ